MLHITLASLWNCLNSRSYKESYLCVTVIYLYFLMSNTLKMFLFFKWFIYFNWRLITLKYCSGFAIHLHEWAIGVHMSPCWNPLQPPSPSHPSGLSRCTGHERPVSGIKSGLAIYFTYGNIHVSMLFSQIIPPSPSPRVQKSVLYLCVSFAVSHIGSSLPSF